jgi:hypothetical protein
MSLHLPTPILNIPFKSRVWKFFTAPAQILPILSELIASYPDFIIIFIGHDGRLSGMGYAKIREKLPPRKCGTARILFEKGHTMNNHNITPSRWYYGLAIGFFIIGQLSLTLFLFNNLSGLTGALTQVVVPAKSEIVFPETGKYTVFYEYQSVVGNRLFFTGERLSGLHCTLTSKVTGYRIPLSRPLTRSTYSLGDRKGVSVLTFNIDQQGQEGPEIVLAMGRGFMKKLLGTIFGGLALFFGSVAIAIAIIVVTLLKRQKARKQLESNYGYGTVYRSNWKRS